MKNQNFSIFNKVDLIQPQRTTIVLPAFELLSSIWAGASRILSEYEFNNSYFFSLRLPINSFGENFVAAISYVEDGIVYRYVLWEHPDAILYYPVYAGERIGANAKLEVWSVDTTDIPLLASDEIFESSQLNFPPSNCSSCCINTTQQINLVEVIPSVINPYAYENPFCSNLCNP